jgi:hypothetical protein
MMARRAIPPKHHYEKIEDKKETKLAERCKCEVINTSTGRSHTAVEIEGRNERKFFE